MPPPGCRAPRPDLAGVILAAGTGERLRPLTDELPKPLCPVGNEPLLQRALGNVAAVAGEVAVNVHAHPDAMLGFLAGFPGVKASLEADRPLGSAGAVSKLRPWIDGRDVMVMNSDTWLSDDPTALMLDGWDGGRLRLLVVERDRPSDFGRFQYIGTSLLPRRAVDSLPAGRSGLYETLWRAAEAAAELDFVEYPGTWFDCGTARRYLEANLFTSGGETVAGRGAGVEGEAVRSVLWDGARVAKGEYLYEAVRTSSGLTVRTEPEPCC